MKKKLRFVILAFLLCACIVGNSLTAFALESGDNVSLDAEKEARKQIVFNEHITIMESNHRQLHEDEDALTLSVSEIKDVYDFAGNKYTLAELEPKGYILFHDESGVFVEYSSRTESPYRNLHGELYYAGIKEYYRKESSQGGSSSGGVEYRHTVIDKTVDENSISEYVSVSSALNDALLAEKNENVVDYIQKNTPLQLESNYVPQDSAAKDEETPQRTTTYNGMTVVDDYTFFTELEDCGYIGGGKCGYIAAGMLMAYRQHAMGESYIPSSYLKYSVSMKVIPNSAGPKITVSTKTTGFYYTFYGPSNSIISQGYINGSSNTWDFALWTLTSGKYKLQAQTSGGNCETQTFTKGTGNNITNTNVVPKSAGPQINVSTGAGGFSYTFYSPTNSIISQGSVNGNSNTWDFSLWDLEPGRHTFQVQASGGNCETVTFTVGNYAISTSLPTTLYNTGVSLGYGADTYANHISSTVNRYLSNNGYAPVNSTFHFLLDANNFRTSYYISNDRPVIWFGEILINTYDSQTSIEHAVVIYGYDIFWGTYNFISHFGWDNATEVYFTGVVGSIYTCWR